MDRKLMKKTSWILKKQHSTKLRSLLSEVKKRNEQDIDITSIDTVIFAGYYEQAKIKARTIVDTFKKFIEENSSPAFERRGVLDTP